MNSIPAPVQYYSEALNRVTTYFRDLGKATLWMKTANPLLGGLTPNQMIEIGRGEKLLRFIDKSLAENFP